MSLASVSKKMRLTLEIKLSDRPRSQRQQLIYMVFLILVIILLPIRAAYSKEKSKPLYVVTPEFDFSKNPERLSDLVEQSLNNYYQYGNLQSSKEYLQLEAHKSKSQKVAQILAPTVSSLTEDLTSGEFKGFSKQEKLVQTILPALSGMSTILRDNGIGVTDKLEFTYHKSKHSLSPDTYLVYLENGAPIKIRHDNGTTGQIKSRALGFNYKLNRHVNVFTGYAKSKTKMQLSEVHGYSTTDKHILLEFDVSIDAR